MSLAWTAMPSCLVPSKRSGFSRKSVGVVPLSVGTMPLSVGPVGTVPLNSKTVAQDGGLSPKRGGRLQVGKALFSCYGDDKPRERKGADIIVETLEREGIEHVFACPGEIHEALTGSKVIKSILCSHEEGEIFAAEGYARSTGKVGVCIATGATNLVSGLVNALRDSIPLVAITTSQGTPILEVTRSITKHTYVIMCVTEIPSFFKEAFFLAACGRPGPVLVDIWDIQQEGIPDWTLNPYLSPQIPQLEQILRLIFNSETPILYVGGGCLNASQELREFVDYTGIPVTTTLMGLGSFPSSDERSLGMLQMQLGGTDYGNDAVRNAVHNADLLLALGVGFDDRVTEILQEFASCVSIVPIDIDVQLALQGLNNLIKNREDRPDFQLWREELIKNREDRPVFQLWREELKEHKTKWPMKYVKFEDAISPQHAIQLLHELTQGNAIIATGVGQHQMWAAQWFKYDRPRQWLTSEGLGVMSFGLPAALGAAVGNPGMTVVNIDGDGSFLMNVQELATIKEENFPVKIMILNNQHLGMVLQWEDRFYKENRAHTYLGDPFSEIFPDFLKMVESCKIPAARVTNEADLKAAISQMLETPGPYLLDVIAPHQDGGGFKHIIIEGDGSSY